MYNCYFLCNTFILRLRIGLVVKGQPFLGVRLTSGLINTTYISPISIEVTMVDIGNIDDHRRFDLVLLILPWVE